MVLFSVVSAALAVGITSVTCSNFLTIVDSGRRLTGFSRGLIAVAVSMILMLNPITWSQAVVVEVYSLALLLQAITWYLLVKYLRFSVTGNSRHSMRCVVLLGLTLGIVGAHHVSGLALFLPVLLVLFLVRNKNLVRTMLIFILSVIPGFLLYLYLPLRSAQNPPLDWGNPETFGALARHVSAAQYVDRAFGVTAAEFFARLGAFDWNQYFGVLGLLLFLAGLIIFVFKWRTAPFKAVGPGIMLFLVWAVVFAAGYSVSDYEIFFYPLFIPVALVMSVGVAWLYTSLIRIRPLLGQLPIVLIIVLSAFALNTRWVDMDLSEAGVTTAPGFAYRQMSVLPDDALVITGTDGYTFALLYASVCGIKNPLEEEKLDAAPGVDVVALDWLFSGWFRENVEARYGSGDRLLLGELQSDRVTSLRHIITLNIGNRPVYVDRGVLDLLNSAETLFESEPVLNLYRIIPSE